MYAAQEEIDFMKSPSLWPFWPRLPIKKGDALACLVEFGLSGVKPTVYHMNLYEEFTEDVPITQFDSFEDLVADGWRVD